MRNTLHQRFQLFDINMIFVQFNFLILKWCTTQCSICTISFLKNMCCICWFSNNNRNICKQTQTIETNQLKTKLTH